MTDTPKIRYCYSYYSPRGFGNEYRILAHRTDAERDASIEDSPGDINTKHYAIAAKRAIQLAGAAALREAWIDADQHHQDLAEVSAASED